MDLIQPPLDDDPNSIFGEKISALVDIALEGGVSDWEFDFIDGAVERFKKGINFSDRQVELVNELYDKYCT